MWTIQSRDIDLGHVRSDRIDTRNLNAPWMQKYRLAAFSGRAWSTIQPTNPEKQQQLPLIQQTPEGVPEK